MDKFTLTTEDSLLLIIDLQEKLVGAMKYGPEAIEKTNVLITAAKELAMPIFLTEQYPQGLGRTVPEISNSLEAVTKFEKTNFSACSEEFISSLKETGRKKIIITGTETHICVFQTARDLIALGYDVFIVEDGVLSRKKMNYKNALELMRSMGASITSTETILFDLIKGSKAPQFRLFSKLIK